MTGAQERSEPGESRAVIALGGNLGDREQTLRAAVHAIDGAAGVRVLAVSGLVESHAWKPHGVDRDAPNYLNAVLLAATTMEPLPLLETLNAIEDAHGRHRDERWGDRTLDLDLIAYDDVEQDDPRLTLPHPRAWQRVFVLEPWLHVQPDAEIPGHGRIDRLREHAEDVVWHFAAPPLFPPPAAAPPLFPAPPGGAPR